MFKHLCFRCDKVILSPLGSNGDHTYICKKCVKVLSGKEKYTGFPTSCNWCESQQGPQTWICEKCRNKLGVSTPYLMREPGYDG